MDVDSQPSSSTDRRWHNFFKTRNDHQELGSPAAGPARGRSPDRAARGDSVEQESPFGTRIRKEDGYRSRSPLRPGRKNSKHEEKGSTYEHSQSKASRGRVRDDRSRSP